MVMRVEDVNVNELIEAVQLGRIRVLTVTEMAAITRMSKMTVYRCIHSGDLTGEWLGSRTIRIPVEADGGARDFLEGLGII